MTRLRVWYMWKKYRHDMHAYTKRLDIVAYTLLSEWLYGVICQGVRVCRNGRSGMPEWPFGDTGMVVRGYRKGRLGMPRKLNGEIILLTSFGRAIKISE